MATVIKRVTTHSGAAGQVVPANEGESLTGAHEVTIQNTHASKTVELNTSSGATFGSGWPIVPGAAFTAVVGTGEVWYAIAADATVVSVAVAQVAQPS